MVRVGPEKPILIEGILLSHCRSKKSDGSILHNQLKNGNQYKYILNLEK